MNIKKTILIFSLFFFKFNFCSAYALKDFIKSSAYGAGSGALLGLVSLAFTDKPGDNASNIAKGASLGLYAGIGYGIYQLNVDNKKIKQKSSEYPDYVFFINPVINKSIEGASADLVFNF